MKNASIIGKAGRLSFAGIVLLSLIMSGCAANAGNSANTGTPGQNSPQAHQAASIEQPRPEAVGTTVSLSIANRNVKAGDTFNVEVVVDSKVPVRCGQVGLTFDPALMKCNEVLEGTFLKDWAQKNGIMTLVLPEAAIDNEKGSVSTMGISIMGDKFGGPSKGVLVSYSFTALKDGTASPKMSNVALAIPSTDPDPQTPLVDLLEKDLNIIN